MIMKIIIKFMAIAVFSLMSFAGAAQNKTKPEIYKADTAVHNYAVLVRTEDHIRAALKTAETLGKKNGNGEGVFEMVVCGEAVELLKQNSALKTMLEKGLESKTRITACGMSLEKQKMEKGTLLPGIKVEENGLIRIFDLQAAGYLTIEL